MDSKEFLSILAGHIGSKVSLVIDAGLYKGTYPSRLEDIDGDALGLAHPLMRGVLLPVHRNVQLKMRVDAGDSLYFSMVSISKGFVRGALPLLWVVPVGEASRIQRRHFVRVPCLLKVAFFRLEGEAYRPETEEWCDVSAKNISLGGIGFAVPHEREAFFSEEMRYLIEIVLPEKKILLVGKIVKKFAKNDIWELGVAFDGVSASIEKLLGGFIRQQELAGRQS